MRPDLQDEVYENSKFRYVYNLNNNNKSIMSFVNYSLEW